MNYREYTCPGSINMGKGYMLYMRHIEADLLKPDANILKRLYQIIKHQLSILKAEGETWEQHKFPTPPPHILYQSHFFPRRKSEKVIPMLSLKIFDIVMTSPKANLKAIIVPGVLRPFPYEGHVLKEFILKLYLLIFQMWSKGCSQSSREGT